MSAYINSLLIEPVVRQARRISYSAADWNPATPLSHASDNDEQDEQLSDLQEPQHPEAQLQSDVDGRTDLRRSSSHPADLSIQTGRDDASVRDARLLDQPRVSSPEGFGDDPVMSEFSEETLAIHSLSRDTRDVAGPPSLEHAADMTRNPGSAVPYGLRGEGARTSIHSGRSRSSVDLTSGRPSGDQGTTSSREGSATNLSMSGNLPDDDGMRPLREKIQLIRDMALSSEEKAMRMHGLMVADYEAFKAAAERASGGPKRSSVSLGVGARHTRMASLDEESQRSATPVSMLSTGDADDLLIVSADDLKPTFQPRVSTTGAQGGTDADTTTEDDDEELSLGCMHYARNVKIQCSDCKRWYTCRHCHDEDENHPLNRKRIRHMLCMICGHAQKASDYCEKCGDAAADYYCDVCQLWENDPNKKIYHCDDCGICRRGEGLGKDFVHCKKCNVCIAIAWISRHRCVERATECDCPICNDWMFTSSAAVVAMQCGHYIHRKCYDEYMHTSYKCPICNRSAVNMELQWRKLDQAIEVQPMPSQFSETKAWISCNDCAARTCTSYHWLGNKCTVCDSYNTNYIKLVNSPTDHELEAISTSEEARALRAAEERIANSDVTQPFGALPREDRAPDATTSAGVNPAAQDMQSSSQGSGRDASDEASQRSRTNTGTTAVNSPPAMPFIGPRRREDSLRERHVEPSDGEDDEDEDDVGFWGEGISPSGWSMPMGISPMSGWTSPSFFATRMEARNGQRRAAGAEGNDDADDDQDEDGEWSTDDSDEESPAEADEDGDVDEIELFGHR